MFDACSKTLQIIQRQYFHFWIFIINKEKLIEKCKNAIVIILTLKKKDLIIVFAAKTCIY